jgi:hypothetical protein
VRAYAPDLHREAAVGAVTLAMAIELESTCFAVPEVCNSKLIGK